MNLFVSIICGLLSFCMEFVVIPLAFSLPPLLGLPDFVWIALRILLPTLVVVLLLRWLRPIPPVFIWAGLPVQYLVLFLFAQGVSGILGISLGGLGGFAYLFQTAVWPLVVTALQFLLLFWAEKRDED